MQFLKNEGAKFRLIDEEIIQESHRVAAKLGITTDDATGRISVPGQESRAEDEHQRKESAENEDSTSARGTAENATNPKDSVASDPSP